MRRALRRFLIGSSLLMGVATAFAQPTFTVTNVKDACAGLNNGSFDVKILTANGSVNLIILGPPNFNRTTSAGLTESFTGLKPQTYIIIAQDADGNTVQSQTINNVPTNISFSSVPVLVNNSNCSTPNGSITISPTGGGGGPYNYFWTGPGAFTASTQNLSNLVGGNYTVTITDPGDNCSFTSGALPITDPSPVVQTVTTASPENICVTDPATISLASSQVLTLPLSYYEILKNGSPTGVRVSGTGGPITLTLPNGSFVNGDVLTVLAVNDLCTPIVMNGSVTVSIHPPATSATLSGTASICAGQSTNLSVAIVGGTGPFSFNITNFGPVAGYNSGAPLSVTPGATTTYTLGGLVTDASGCTVAGSGSATVTVNPLPTATVNASPATICAGQGNSTLTFTLTGTGPTFDVKYSDGATTFTLLGISTGHSVVVSPAATTTYTITSIKDATTSCVGAPGSSTTVTVNTPPSSATINLPGPNPICAGQNTFLSVTIVGGTGPYDFTIPGLPPQVGYTSGNIITVSPAVTTPYILAGATVTDSKGCTVNGSGGVLVVVNPVPTAVVTASPGTICIGQGSSTLTFTMTGTGPYNVIYSDGTSAFNLSGVSTGQTVVVNPLTTTTYVITSIQDATGCFGVSGSNTTVTVNTPPSNATLSGTSTICSGATTNLSVVITGGTAPYTVTINNGVPVQNNYVSGSAIPVSPVVTTAYGLVSVTDANGCQAQVLAGSATVTVNPGPTSGVLSGTNAICTGGSTNLVVTITGGTAPYSFTINNGVGLQVGYISGTAIPVSPAATTTYSIAGNVTDAIGCFVAGSGSATVTVNTPPSNATLGGTSTICSGTAANLSVVITGGTAPYTVTINNGVPVQNNYVSASAIPVSPVATTAYSLVSVTDANGCPAQVLAGSANVTVNPSPTSGVLSGTNTICAGGSTNLIVTITGGTAPYSFTINNGVGLQSGYISGTAIPVSPVATTAFSIAGNVTDANGCFVAGSGSATVTVNTPPGNATLSGSNSICTGASTNLSVVIVGGTAPYTVTINNGVPVQNNYVSGSAIPVSPGATTTYSLVSVTDAVGCPAQALAGSATITINTGPTSGLLSGTSAICSGGTTNLTVTITGGTAPYSFTIDNGVGLLAGYTSGTAITVSPAATTTYSIVGNVTDANGCFVAGSGNATVTISPQSNAVLSGSSSICIGQPATLTIDFTTGAGPWDIVYSDGSTNTSLTNINVTPFNFNPVPNPIVTTTYSLVSVTSSCGPGTVSGTATITINPIPGNPATFGIDTWLGYVYDDAGDPTPLPARINFSNAKYHGFIDENDIAAMSPFSTYNTVTDEFDLNISDNASGFTIHSPNVCGSFNDDFSIRYRMRKTFAKGVYTFTVGSDDGVRLFLDGVSIIPAAFINQAYTTYTSAAQCISAGQHDLVIEYYERTGFSRLTFNYQSAPAPAVTTPVTTCVNSAAPTLTASSADPAVTGFNWYKDAALTTLLFNGANFTPNAADLDMTVAATTSFFATAVYACGETVAAQVDVNVVNTAVITPPAPPTQICQSGGIVDLTTLVTAIPAGGTFTFSGTGVTISPSFDPTLVAGTTTITANYTSGACSASVNFNIDVVTVADITVPASPVAACQTSGLIDMTALVSATPAGGTFTFTGAGVAGTNFDPSAQSGAVPITVDYNAGGCTDSKTLNFNVTATATLTISNATVCPASGIVNLSGLVSAVPAGGTFTFSGPSVAGNNFDPSSHAGSVVMINVDYDQGGCTASGTISVTVRNAGDPLCGGLNCNVFTVTVTDTRPSCTNQNDGVVNINVSGGTPNYVITLTDGAGFNQAMPGPGPLFTFTNLSPANYLYTIQDGSGNSCTLPHSLPIQTTVHATAGNFVDALCFNQPVGGATVTVNSGGTPPYEYSIDGGTTWIAFTSPVTINNLMPNAAPYSILVRDDAADLCPTQVMVTVHNAVADILSPYTVTNATCANNDGSIQIGTISGGTPPYTYVMDGVNLANLPANNTFTALAGGGHLFTVIDANNCSKDFPIIVTFPGLVNFTTTSVDPDCSGNGTNGQLIVTITSVGSFQVGISTDPNVPPPVFQNVVSAGNTTLIFSNLSRGTYYIRATALNAQCPTITQASLAAGPAGVDFLLTADDILCFESTGGVTLKTIQGAAGVNYNYQILNSGNVVQSGLITTLQAVADVSVTGLAKGSYQIQLTQDQSAASGCAAPISSAFKPFTVNGPVASLDTLYVNKHISLPDIATGSMLIGIKESGQEPYEVKLELIQSRFPTQFYFLDWTAAARNPQNLRVEYNATKLFAGQYKLSLRDALGCEKEFTITLEVDTDVFIPNIFTPNNDGVNDVFFIRNLPVQSNIIITNRWGKEVYRSGDYKNDWSGGNSDDGIYYYRLNAGGQTFNGWLEIQRGLGQP